MTHLRWLLLLTVAAVAACRTGGAPHAGVDLAPAKEALEAARQAGAPEKAPETFSRAANELQEAERLVQAGGPRAETQAVRAEGTARLAQAEARSAAAQAQRAAKGSQEQERLAARLRRAEEEQHRLEDQVVLLKRDLEDTETELIRTKARLKGIETKAEASSAIAEARILTRRLDAKARGATLARCQELLTKAEQEMQTENFSGAVYLALKAQDMAVRAREAAAPPGSTEADVDRPAPKPSYVVRAATVNLRSGPSTSDEVVAKVGQGETLRATAVRGDWLKVSYRGVVGWLHSSLVE